MKLRYILPLLLAAITFINAGCSTTKPPTKTEEVFFEVQTNFVEQVVLKTNEVLLTNWMVVNKTNEIGQVVFLTNEVIIPKYDLISVTQTVEAYTFTPSTNALADVQIVGGIVNTFAPGIGTIVTGILGGALAMWGRMRSYKKTGTVLAQNIEALREFIKTIPGGSDYDQIFVKWLKEHQDEAGAAEQVAMLLKKYVSNPEAQVAAKELQGLLESLKKT